jgi:hypothetical protein
MDYTTSNSEQDNPPRVVKRSPALTLILTALHEASTEFARIDPHKSEQRFITEGNHILTLITDLEDELK